MRRAWHVRLRAPDLGFRVFRFGSGRGPSSFDMTTPYDLYKVLVMQVFGFHLFRWPPSIPKILPHTVILIIEPERTSCFLQAAK